MVRAIKKESKMQKLEKEVKEVEAYEYLLVEYLKEISNEITYLILIISSLFLFVLIDIIPNFSTETPLGGYESIKLVFILIIIGGFALFGVSGITKRRIEKKFELMFRNY